MTKRSKAEEQELLKRIKSGDERILNKLYGEYRTTFLRWAMKQHKCDEDEASEVYQKAFSICYFNIKDGKLQELSSSLETYLFGIGKRILFELFRQRSRQGVSLDEVSEASVLDLSYLKQDDSNHRKQVVGNLLMSMGETCRTILKLYYFKRYSMEAIAIEMGYKNDKVAKKKKYECLKKLKQMVDTTNHESSDLLSNI